MATGAHNAVPRMILSHPEYQAALRAHIPVPTSRCLLLRNHVPTLKRGCLRSKGRSGTCVWKTLCPQGTSLPHKRPISQNLTNFDRCGRDWHRTHRTKSSFVFLLHPTQSVSISSRSGRGSWILAPSSPRSRLSTDVVRFRNTPAPAD